MAITFFEEMPGFSQFNELTDESHYRVVPEDWWVVITDVIGSTKAVEAGRYKDVITVGAATLVALRNAIPDLKFPFVFGGDGASALIPQEYKNEAVRELSALRALASKRFRLGLRVGMISCSELRALAGPIYVAKFLLQGRYPLALFRGGALSAADRLIKDSFERYEVPEIPDAETDLRALSCRWKAIQASKGCALAILASGPHGDDTAIGYLLTEIDRILEPNMEAANPLQNGRMSYRGLWQMITADGLHQGGPGGRLARIKETIIAYLFFKLGLSRLFDRFHKYKAAIPAHCDFRKFDDMLRMITDCTPEQADEIGAVCERLRQAHGLIYGLHRNRAALMTCYVPGYGDGEHVHFIDGADGGYTLAAKQFKAQLKSDSATSSRG